MIAIQSNEGLLVKSLSEQGFILEKISFEKSLMSSNKENKNSSENNRDDNFNNDKIKILDDEEDYNDEKE